MRAHPQRVLELLSELAGPSRAPKPLWAQLFCSDALRLLRLDDLATTQTIRLAVASKNGNLDQLLHETAAVVAVATPPPPPSGIANSAARAMAKVKNPGNEDSGIDYAYQATTEEVSAA